MSRVLHVRKVAIAAALVAVLFVSQALVAGAQSEAAAIKRKSTGQVVGHAGFAMLGGLRTFAAATLLNRLDPIHDTYFGHKGSIVQEKYLLPTLRMVTILDPKFIYPYYNAAYLVSAGGDRAEGVRIAREGVANNPKSGLLRASLVQMLMLQDEKKNLPEMVAQSQIGLRKGMKWESADDVYEGIGIFRVAFKLSGDTVMAERLLRAQQQLQAVNTSGGGAPAPAGSATGSATAQ